MAINEGQGRRNQGNQAIGRAFMLGAEEARLDPNIMTGTFILNNHYATTLFDSGGDYNFVSTTIIPMLDIKPSDLGFSYEIEIASGQLVEIDKSFCAKPLKILEALAKKQDSCAEDVMSRTYTSLTLRAIITVSLLELKIVPLFSSN
ncbi:hypothetical protein Tco_1246461 [Tanacetum coccineum]